MSFYDDIEDTMQDDREEMDEDDIRAYYCREWFELKDREENLVLSCDYRYVMEVRE